MATSNRGRDARGRIAEIHRTSTSDSLATDLQIRGAFGVLAAFMSNAPLPSDKTTSELD